MIAGTVLIVVIGLEHLLHVKVSILLKPKHFINFLRENISSNFCFHLVIDCGDPGTLSNGSRTGSVFTFGGTVRYRCNQGYKLSGSSIRTCEASGRWSGDKAVCKGRSM